MTLITGSGLCITDVVGVAAGIRQERDLLEQLPQISGAKWGPYSYGGYKNSKTHLTYFYTFLQF